jgi:hypothetical protein
MLQNDIRRADAVRHMSVDAGTRAADRADSHGHRPQNRLTCPNTQGRPLPGGGTRPSVDTALAVRGGWAKDRDLRPLPVDLDKLVGILDFAGYSPQRQRLIGYGSCVRSPEPGRMRSWKSRTMGFRRARTVETTGLAAWQVGIVA